MKSRLRYKNEDDKCYGATGMAMAVVIFDGEDKLAGIDLDADPESIISFTSDFYFNGNPGYSAKNAWNQILNNFNLAMALSLGNVLCRSYILEGKQPDEELARYLRTTMIEEGAANCALEEDETSHLFDKNYTYLSRVFNHQGVQSVAHDFARALKAHRSMTRMDILDHLHALTML